jgi:hypothetical protein
VGLSALGCCDGASSRTFSALFLPHANVPTVAMVSQPWVDGSQERDAGRMGPGRVCSGGRGLWLSEGGRVGCGGGWARVGAMRTLSVASTNSPFCSCRTKRGPTRSSPHEAPIMPIWPWWKRTGTNDPPLAGSTAYVVRYPPSGFSHRSGTSMLSP